MIAVIIIGRRPGAVFCWYQYTANTQLFLSASQVMSVSAELLVQIG